MKQIEQPGAISHRGTLGSRSAYGLGALFARAKIPLWLIAPGVLLVAQAALLELAPLALVYGVIHQLAPGGAHNFALLSYFAGLSLAALVCAALLNYAGVAWCAWLAGRMVKSLRDEVADRLVDLEMANWYALGSLGLRQRIEDNLDQIRLCVARQLPTMLHGILLPLMLVTLMLVVDWRLALVALIPLPITLALIVRGAKAKAVHNLKESYYSSRSQLHQRMIEYFDALPAIKLYPGSAGSDRSAPLAAAIDNFYTFMCRWISLITPPWARLYSLLLNLGLPVLALGVWLYQQDMLSARVLLLFALLGGAYVRPLFALANSGSQLALVREAHQQFAESLPPVAQQQASQLPTTCEYELRDVVFDYGDTRVFRGLELRLPAQGCVALVGPSGSGKSTLAALLAGIVVPASGSLQLGGVELSTLSQAQRTGLIAPVWQQTCVLDDSLAANIVLGSQLHIDKVEAAAAKAGLSELIARLPKGLHTRLGSDTARLSGGEAQRVQIARAVYRATPVVILDEATALSDADNEYAIQQAIAGLTACRLLVVITHRLATVERADQIVVLDRNRLVGQGSHAELRKNCPCYARLWQVQNQPIRLERQA